jgi:hypothetical protein
VAHQQAKEDRAVEEIERDLDVEIAAHLAVADRLFEEHASLGAAREHEVVAERLRELRLGIRCGDHRRHVPAGRRGEALGDRAELELQCLDRSLLLALRGLEGKER